jgi:hypothetical protein
VRRFGGAGKTAIRTNVVVGVPLRGTAKNTAKNHVPTRAFDASINKLLERGVMRKLVLGLLAIVAAPWALRAQSYLDSGSMAGPGRFGSGEPAVLGYAGENVPRNSFLVNLDGDAGYDDNVLYTNAHKVGDAFTSFGPRFTYLRQQKKFRFDADYTPYVVLYRRFNQYDYVNQGLNLDMAYRFTPRFEIRAREDAAYFMGVFQPHGGMVYVPGLDQPSSLTSTIYTPLSRVFSTSSRVDLIYHKSARTQFDFFGSFLSQNYSHLEVPGTALPNVRGGQGGVVYSYRLTKKSTISGVYNYDNFYFVGSSRSEIHSGILSFAHSFNSALRFEVFGGPQHAHLRDRFVIELPLSIFGTIVYVPLPLVLSESQWNWSGGGDVQLRSGKTTFVLTGQRLVSGNGGFVRAGTNSAASFNVQRLLGRRWQANAFVTYAKFSTLPYQGLPSAPAVQSLDNMSAGVGLQRSLAEKLTAVLNYSYARQRTGAGYTPLFADVDHNRVSLGLMYNVGRIRLGR